MKRTVLKDFPYSHDGITLKFAKNGETVDIPDGYCDGLEKEKYIAPLDLQKAPPAPTNDETKMQGPSPENKSEDGVKVETKVEGDKDESPEMIALRSDYFALAGKGADGRWKEDRLRAEIEALKNPAPPAPTEPAQPTQ